jgi:DNA-binding transcriptional LysR family regulator
VASPRWLRKHGAIREPDELARKPCLMQVTPSGAIIPWSLTQEGGSAVTRVIDAQGRIRTNAPSALRELSLRGAGVAYLPDWLVAADLRRGDLKRVLPRWSSAPLMAWAIYRAELRGSPKLRAFLEALPASSAAAEE